MRMRFIRLSYLVIGGICIAFFVNGCAWCDVNYDKHTNLVWNIPAKIPCYGGITVTRYHGMVHFGVCGTWWDSDGYGIFFKKPTGSSNDFYFTMNATNDTVTIVEARGTVRLTDTNRVLIDIQYKDANGSWKKPPINGHRKIDYIYSN